jgi:hypothetical protein
MDRLPACYNLKESQRRLSQMVGLRHEQTGGTKSMTPRGLLPRSYTTYGRLVPAKLAAAACLVLVCGCPFAAHALGDEFSRLDGPAFFALTSRADARLHSHLTLRQLDATPAVLRDERAALVLAKTDEGNLAKLLVSTGFRKLKPSAKDGPLLPVLIVERFETIDSGDRRSLKSHGKELTLFDGFQFDLDAGQVVPQGLGGDIVFLNSGPDGPRLAALNGAQLYTLEKPLAFPATSQGKPSDGRAVVPTDFTGRYLLMANGQWSGLLDLAVDQAGAVTGHFRSDRNGAAYAVTGQVAPDVAQKVGFSVQFPRARQTYEGYLWSEGKNVIAGSMSMLDHPYSFFALREGAPLFSAALDLDEHHDGAGIRARVVKLEPGADRYVLDGQARTAAELTDALAQAVKAEATARVLLRVSGAVPFERVRRAAETIRAAGVRSIKLALDGDQGQTD